MPLLPEQVHQRLASEFKLAAEKVTEAPDLAGKLYFFSTFFGETGRQLNNHWDAHLALLPYIVQIACQLIPAQVTQLPPPVALPPEDFLRALDEVSNELASAFATPDIDMPRLYAAMGRVAELVYVTSGNGAYLRMKGMITV